MVFNSKSLGNLKQNRRKQTDTAPESLPMMPVMPTDLVSDAASVNNQQVAQKTGNPALDYISRYQPVLAQELVRIALARKTPASVKLQALLEGLTIGGTRQAPGKAATAIPADMGLNELQAFILAGTEALRLQKAAKQAIDAEVVVSPSGS